jgi:uncharacterized protein YjiS (DUF1127 family)
MNVLHTHLSDAPVTGGTAAGSGLRRAALAALAGIETWVRARREQDQLARLDSRSLHDLALTRVDVARELEAPVLPIVLASMRDAWRRS